MSIIQTFYDNLATQYDKLFLDWQAATKEQAEILNRIFVNYGFDNTAKILDCACGIGTQAIGVAALGYNVTASDITANGPMSGNLAMRWCFWRWMKRSARRIHRLNILMPY